MSEYLSVFLFSIKRPVVVGTFGLTIILFCVDIINSSVSLLPRNGYPINRNNMQRFNSVTVLGFADNNNNNNILL